MYTKFSFTMFVILLLMVININADEEFEIPAELTSHRNWKLLDIGDNCGTSGFSKIIGGTDAALGEYPWMVRIGYTEDFYSDTPETFDCGGSIISSRYILTAAHCGSGEENERKRIVQVVAGENFVNTEIDCDEHMCAEPLQKFAVEEERCHTDYDAITLVNDICLIRLNASIKLSDFVLPICLPAFEFMFNDTAFGNSIVETTGWGLTHPNADLRITSNALQVLKMPMVHHKNCSAQYYEFGRVKLTERQMCAGGEVGKDSCRGDSGGPLMKVCSVNSMPRYFLIGVTSFGPSVCADKEKRLPGIYTVVYKYWDWILETIRE